MWPIKERQPNNPVGGINSAPWFSLPSLSSLPCYEPWEPDHPPILLPPIKERLPPIAFLTSETFSRSFFLHPPSLERTQASAQTRQQPTPPFCFSSAEAETSDDLFAASGRGLACCTAHSSSCSGSSPSNSSSTLPPFLFSSPAAQTTAIPLSASTSSPTSFDSSEDETPYSNPKRNRESSVQVNAKEKKMKKKNKHREKEVKCRRTNKPSPSSPSSSSEGSDGGHVTVKVSEMRGRIPSFLRGGFSCESCKTQHTSQWRRGPSGATTLCNACGLYFARTKQFPPPGRRKEKQSRKGSSAQLPLDSNH
ncbi:GATA factor SREP [Balamuthia mandrillaris]